MDRSHLPSSEEEARTLDTLLADYSQSEGVPFDSHIKLSVVSRVARHLADGGRLFDYCVELQVQCVFLQLDLVAIARKSEGDVTQQKALPSFIKRTQLVRHNSDFVLRYRAVWDKVMAVLVLIAAPTEFPSFDGSKKRKASFKKIAERSGRIPTELVSRIIETTEHFDSRYRTAEAHGSGSTRRLVGRSTPEPESDQANMFWASNALNEVLVGIARVFQTLDSKLANGRGPA